MSDKRVALLWGGLLGAMAVMFAMNNWIKGQIEETVPKVQQAAGPAVPVPARGPSTPAGELVQELIFAEQHLAPATEPAPLSQQEEPEDPDPVYETPLVSPILQQ